MLDIVPTGEMWRGMDAARAMAVYHWMFLAQPEPLPETLIARSAREYIDHTLASWTTTRSLACFGEEALTSYRAAFADPARIHAFCEDYRAGATIDRANDERDMAAGDEIAAPLLALWGDHGIPAAGADPSGRVAALGERRPRPRRGVRALRAGGGAGGDAAGAGGISSRERGLFEAFDLQQ